MSEYITLPNMFNIKNTINLVGELNNISINQNTRIFSFDITNMYTNIPLNILTNIIRNTLLKEEIPQVIIYEIDRMTRLVKFMVFNFLFNRLNTYPLNNIDKNNELQMINQTAKENGYRPTSMALKFNANKKTKYPTYKPRYSRKQEMGSIHICRKGNKIHNQIVQEYKHKNSI
jgi:hypothetical protein